MCGICGILDFSDINIQQELVTVMAKTLEHRGPDHLGVFVSDSIGMGHARLSIIDLSPSGHQPMLDMDRQCALVCNGEIYNFRELRKILEGKGRRFRGNSDSEVVLEAYMEWGVEAFARFDGMFAFALWDGISRQLHIVRDRFGIKPLYYYPTRSGIIFGSEVKAILASGKIDRSMNIQALHEYLYYGSALGGHSLFEGISKLLPGYRLTVARNGIEISQYASVADIEPVTDDLKTATQELRRILDMAVKRHLISDVPVGVFLSGGIDSSTITALASRHYQERLKTYSVGFDFERGVSELPKARIVAQHFGTDHHELHIAGKDIPHVMESLVRCHDEPFGDAADIPLYLLCEELKGSIKVVLQGDGGDEIFAGYRRYNVLSSERFWRVFARVGAMINGRLPPSPANYRYSRFFQAMKNSDPAMMMALLLTEESLSDPPTRVLSQAMKNEVNKYDPFSRYREFYARFSNLNPVQRMLYTDCNIILPDIFLEKVDKATMAHGIEVRVPLLDNQLTRYCMGLPSSMKVRFGRKKWLLRNAMRGIVPDSILDGKKTGFSVPYAFWLKGPVSEFMKSVLLDKSIVDWGIFDADKIEMCIQEHMDGKRNNGFLLYKLLNLSLWYKFYLAR